MRRDRNTKKKRTNASSFTPGNTCTNNNRAITIVTSSSIVLYFLLICPFLAFDIEAAIFSAMVTSAGKIPETMQAMTITKVTSLQNDKEEEEGLLVFVNNMPIPQPKPNEILLRVSVCGVCHTELDEIEGRTPPPSYPVVPGHEVIGRVVQAGHQVTLHKIGDRVGVGWIYDSCDNDGSDVEENLSTSFRATGRDANGGYAQYMLVQQSYAYPIPSVFTDEEAAPLLCAGGVGYRALKLTNMHDGQTLGLMGFGGSAHIVLQLAKHLYPNSNIYVFARSEDTRQFALALGASWAGNINEEPPKKIDAIIDTTPAWTPILASLTALKPGGRLVINAIRKEDFDRHVLSSSLDYAKHIWMEKEIKSVANVSRKDLRDFLVIAGEIPIKTKVTSYPLQEANVALKLLKKGGVQGAYVIKVD